MYKARDQAEILKELQSYSELPVSNIEGTFEYDVFSSNSIEFGKVEVELEQLYNAAFADTAWGDFLTARAAEAGVIRKLAVKATGTVTVSGSGEIPKGSQFATETGIQFETEESVTVNTTVTIPVKAVVAGTNGNVAAGAINTISVSIPGIRDVTNSEATYGGYDGETDKALLARYLLHVRNPGTTGNKSHYLEWALAVPGVGSASVVPTWNGPNTVKVIIVDANRDTANAELIKRVADYIETVRPIGAQITVISASKKVIDISVKINGFADKDSIKAAVVDYFKNITTSYVSIAKIGDIIFHTTGVEDYTALLLNGNATNVALSDEELPVIGEVRIE